MTPKEWSILRAVHRLRYTSAHEVQAMLPDTSLPKVSRYLSGLHAAKLVCRKLMTVNRLRIGSLYALAPKGAQLLAQEGGKDLSAFYYPKGGIQCAGEDFFHRKAFAKLLAHFYNWADAHDSAEISDVWHYRQLAGSNRNAAGVSVNRLLLDDGRVIVPDGVLRFQAGQVSRLIAAEIDRETETSDIIRKIEAHMRAIEQGALRKKFDHDKANFVLIVTATDRRMQNVLRVLNDPLALRARRLDSVATLHEPAKFLTHFHFSTLDTIAARGFNEAFFLVNGEPSRLFA